MLLGATRAPARARGTDRIGAGDREQASKQASNLFACCRRPGCRDRRLEFQFLLGSMAGQRDCRSLDSTGNDSCGSAHCAALMESSPPLAGRGKGKGRRNWRANRQSCRRCTGRRRWAGAALPHCTLCSGGQDSEVGAGRDERGQGQGRSNNGAASHRRFADVSPQSTWPIGRVRANSS